MKTLGMGLVLSVFVHSAVGYAANPKLEATMNGILTDLAVVTAPTKKADPTDVTKAMLLGAIIRARTAAFLLQTAVDRAGKVVAGNLVADELTPPGLGTLTGDELVAKLDLYVRYLQSAKEKFSASENLLNAQFLLDPRARSFGGVKTTLDELGAIITAAHGVFKPKKPE